MSKISALPTLTNPAKDDFIPIVDDSDDTTKQMTLATLLNMIYPVGSIYTNATDDTNPGTLLGFGTWVAYAEGRVLVGLNGSDSDFDTEEQTGGQKTVQAHSHSVSLGVADDFNPPYNERELVRTDNNMGNHNFNTGVTGTGSTNMNPYIVVHMWKRTA